MVNDAGEGEGPAWIALLDPASHGDLKRHLVGAPRPRSDRGGLEAEPWAEPGSESAPSVELSRDPARPALLVAEHEVVAQIEQRRGESESDSLDET